MLRSCPHRYLLGPGEKEETMMRRRRYEKDVELEGMMIWNARKERERGSYGERKMVFRREVRRKTKRCRVRRRDDAKNMMIQRREGEEERGRHNEYQHMGTKD